MPNPSFYQKILAFVHNAYSKDVGKALIVTSTAGWVLSAVAQLYMVATNDKIDKKQKKFLIPQEIADGVVNVGLYYTICKVIKNYADNLVEKGQIVLRGTDSIIAKLKTDNQPKACLIRGIGETIADHYKYSDKALTEVELEILKNEKKYTENFFKKTIRELKTEIIGPPITEKKIKCKNVIITKEITKSFKTIEAKTELLATLKQAQKEFAGFKNGVGVIAAIGASVLAANVITPVCRNIVANKFQDKYLRKIQPKPVYKLPISAKFCSFQV